MKRRDRQRETGRGRRECRAAVCARFANCLAEQVKSASEAEEPRVKIEEKPCSTSYLLARSLLWLLGQSERDSVVWLVRKEGSKRERNRGHNLTGCIALLFVFVAFYFVYYIFDCFNVYSFVKKLEVNKLLSFLYLLGIDTMNLANLLFLIIVGK